MTTADLCAAFGVGGERRPRQGACHREDPQDRAFDRSGRSQPGRQQSTCMDGRSEWSAGRLRHDAPEVQEVAFAKGSFPTSPRIDRIDRDRRSQGAQHGGRSVSQAPEKESPKGLRGWPSRTVAFYGPNLSQATKVAVGIRAIRECSGGKSCGDWKVDRGDIRSDPEHCPRDA